MKKRLFVVLIFAALFAFPVSQAYAGQEGAATSAVADQSETQKKAEPTPGPPVVAPPPIQGASGQWVLVPGESVGGKWVPPHRVWVPASPAPPSGQGGYVLYTPKPTYVSVPSPPPTFASVITDIFFLRPLGIAGLALGTGASIVAMPFALPSGSAEEVGQALIVGPYDFTFRRPLGVW